MIHSIKSILKGARPLVISIRDKVNEKMDRLEKLVANNHHISHPHIVRELLKEIHKYYTILEPEDREYVDCVDNVVGRDDKWY